MRVNTAFVSVLSRIRDTAVAHRHTSRLCHLQRNSKAVRSEQNHDRLYGRNFFNTVRWQRVRSIAGRTLTEYGVRRGAHVGGRKALQRIHLRVRAISVYLFLADAASSCYRTWIPAPTRHRGVQQSWSDVKRTTQWREKGTLVCAEGAQPMSRAPLVRAPHALLMMQSA